MRPANSDAELLELARASVNQAVELYAGAETNSFLPRHCHRLAIVAENASDLQAKLGLAAQQIGTAKELLLARKQVYLGRVAQSAGKIAFVFSGQGSQYAGMLRPLVQEFPVAAATMNQLDEILRELGFPSFAEVAWGDGESLGKDVWLTQLSLLCADLIAYRALQSLGIQPDLVAGHSFGEFPALAASGIWDAHHAILGTRARCDAIEACRNVRGRMLSAAAPGSKMEQLCTELGGQVYAANYNAPDQTVVGGDEESITRLIQRLKAEKIACKLLAVPRPFHTPLMESVKTPLAQGLADVRFQPPRVPLLSSVNNRMVSSPEQACSNLIAQMTSPVRYVQLVEQLADLGARAIVEVGPRDVLTRLNAKILRDRNVDVMACDEKTTSGVVGLLAVQARLDSLGLLDFVSPTPPVDIFAVPDEVASASSSGHETDQLAGESRATTSATRTPDVIDVEPTELSGEPLEAGRQLGAASGDGIRRLARRFADFVGVSAGDQELATLIRQSQVLETQLSKAEREELQGIAEVPA